MVSATTLRFACLTLAAAAVLGARPARQGERALALTHVTVVDVAAASDSAAERPDQTVLVVHGRISAVGPADSVRLPGDARVVDGRGRWLIPGLWDAHSHVGVAGDPALAAYLANGITTVRDLGGPLPELQRWRAEIAAGERRGPRLLVAGPIVEGAWWLDMVAHLSASDPALRAFPFLERSPRVRLAAPGDAARVVDSLRSLGVDVVKFRNLRGNEFRALAAAARRRGMTLVGHAPLDVSIAEAAEDGMRSIEHAATITPRFGALADSARRAQLRRVAKARTAITPTLVTDHMTGLTPELVARAAVRDSASRRDPRRRYVTRRLLDFWEFGLAEDRHDTSSTAESRAAVYRREVADMRLAHEAGVTLLVGTDLGVPLVYPGFSVHEELQYLVDEVGLTPLEALRAASLAPARVSGVADSLGVIAPGQLADLVLLNADPLRDIHNTTYIRAVVANGRLLSRSDLDRMLEQSARDAARSFEEAAP